MKKIGVILFVLIVLTLPLFSAKTIKVANYYAIDHPVNQGLLNVFKPIVEYRTKGALKVEIYPNSQLGAEQEFVEGVQIGTIEMAVTGNLWENSIPEFRIMQLPYMFNDYDHADKVLNGEIGQKIYKYLEKLGVLVLGEMPNGFRAVSNSKKPIYSVEDCKGIKLRVFQGETIIKEMKALGFDTVVMPISEVFSALQQGVVDGQDNPVFTLYFSGWYEVQKYVALTRHMYSPAYLVINKRFWDKLSDDQKEIIKDAAFATTRYVFHKMKMLESDIIAKLKEAGLVVTEPNIKPFREKTWFIVEEYIKKYPHTKEIIETIQEVGK